MKTITDISPQKNNSKRCNVYLDGAFFCGLGLETVVSNRLKVGQTVTESELAHIQYDGEKSDALDKSMLFLSASIKTKKQVREYLVKKGYTFLVIDYVLDKLSEYKFVDDENYAKIYVSNYKSGKGARKLSYELKQKGVGEEEIESAVSEIGDQTDDAARIVGKLFRNKEIDIKLKQKAYRHLLSRGFSYDVAKSAVEKVLGEISEEL